MIGTWFCLARDEASSPLQGVVVKSEKIRTEEQFVSPKKTESSLRALRPKNRCAW